MKKIEKQEQELGYKQIMQEKQLKESELESFKAHLRQEFE